jgi:S-(hydroxymethyl)glutathione dehydrogenase/alcohol dehydrogenase
MARIIRAAVLEGPGAPLRVEELELTDPGPGQVLVRMEASGVCHSDLHQADGDWGDPGPIVLGHEGAGHVLEVGEGVEHVSPGDLVALNWFAPCTSCPSCAAGRPWTCTGTLALDDRLPDGSRPLRRADGSEIAPMLGLGTFAEEVVVGASAAVPMPSGVSPEVAALIGCGVTTGVMAVLRAAEVPEGASVTVIGLGGVGLSIVMGAVIAGASTIVAVDRVPEKLEHARALGATQTVLATEDRALVAAEIREATGGDPGFAFEAIGLTETVELAIDVVGAGGTALVVGIPPHGHRASFDVGVLVDRSARIVGCNYGWSIPDEDFPRLARLSLDGRLPVDRLIEERIGLDDVGAALEALRAARGLRRVVVFDGGGRP